MENKFKTGDIVLIKERYFQSNVDSYPQVFAGVKANDKVKVLSSNDRIIYCKLKNGKDIFLMNREVDYFRGQLELNFKFQNERNF